MREVKDISSNNSEILEKEKNIEDLDVLKQLKLSLKDLKNGRIHRVL